MKKTKKHMNMKRWFALIVAVTMLSIPTTVSAESINKNSSQAVLDEFVKDAPTMDIGWYHSLFGFAFQDKMVDQYKVQPGKYYILMKPGKGKFPHFSFKLVKVIRVYEDPTWYGSERAIDYVNAETHQFGSAYLNKGLKPAHLYEIDKWVKR